MSQGSSELIEMLSKIDPSRNYGDELFEALARITVSVAVEAVCLRLQKCCSAIEVYLVKRPESVLAYPGEWHCPGSVLRPGENISDVFKRLAQREFGGEIESHRFVTYVNHLTEARGHFLSLVYLCELGDDKDMWGKWFRVGDYPEPMMEHHARRVIPAVFGAFVADLTNPEFSR